MLNKRLDKRECVGAIDRKDKPYVRAEWWVGSRLHTRQGTLTGRIRHTSRGEETELHGGKCGATWYLRDTTVFVPLNPR